MARNFHALSKRKKKISIFTTAEDDNGYQFIKLTQDAFSCKISGYEPFKSIMRNYDFFPPIALKLENINREKLSYFFLVLK